MYHSYYMCMVLNAYHSLWLLQQRDQCMACQLYKLGSILLHYWDFSNYYSHVTYYFTYSLALWPSNKLVFPHNSSHSSLLFSFCHHFFTSYSSSLFITYSSLLILSHPIFPLLSGILSKMLFATLIMPSEVTCPNYTNLRPLISVDISGVFYCPHFLFSSDSPNFFFSYCSYTLQNAPLLYTVLSIT